jgi:hypothetical protein
LYSTSDAGRIFLLDIAELPNPDMSAEDRSWWLPAIVREVGGRKEDLEASGVLFRLPIMLLAMVY